MSRQQSRGKRRSEDLTFKLRTRIVEGKIKPGDRMPTRTQLVSETGACSTAVQAAFDSLIRDGYVESRGSNGSYVTENPPHLTTTAIVLGAEQGQFLHSFAIRQVMEEVAQKRDIQLKAYTLPQVNRTPGDIPQLLDDVLNHRVGSIIFGEGDGNLHHTPIIDMPGIHRAFIATQPMHGYPSAYPDLTAFLHTAVQHLLERGRKRIAHLFLDPYYNNPDEQFNMLRQIGNEVRDSWIQHLPVGVRSSFRAAAGIVTLWMDLDESKRPDAIVVHDDHMVEHVISGLMRCGVRVPTDVEVVAMANFPSARPSGLPITRLGYDMAVVLDHCFDHIERQRHDSNIEPSVTLVPPVFESDLSQAVHMSASAELPFFANPSAPH